MHRSAPALFFCFDRVVIFICTSLSAKITAHVLGVWTLPRSGKYQEAAFLMHNASKKLTVGAEAVVFGGEDGSLLEVGEGECLGPNPAVRAGTMCHRVPCMVA